ncbi:MAG: hypothetical protein ACXVCP_06710 [Bdellovibrio sp.]
MDGPISCDGLFNAQPASIEKRILNKPIQVGIAQTAEHPIEWISQNLHTNVKERNSLNECFTAIKELPIGYLIAIPLLKF